MARTNFLDRFSTYLKYIYWLTLRRFFNWLFLILWVYELFLKEPIFSVSDCFYDKYGMVRSLSIKVEYLCIVWLINWELNRGGFLFLFSVKSSHPDSFWSFFVFADLSVNFFYFLVKLSPVSVKDILFYVDYHWWSGC